MILYVSTSGGSATVYNCMDDFTDPAVYPIAGLHPDTKLIMPSSEDSNFIALTCNTIQVFNGENPPISISFDEIYPTVQWIDQHWCFLARQDGKLKHFQATANGDVAEASGPPVPVSTAAILKDSLGTLRYFSYASAVTPKYGAGVIKDNRDNFYYISEDGCLVSVNFQNTDDILRFSVPGWSKIGGTEYRLTGTPIFTESNTLICMSEENKILRYDAETGTPLGEYGVANLTGIGYTKYTAHPDGLSTDKDSIDFGEVPIGAHSEIMEITLEVDRQHPNIIIKADESTRVALKQQEQEPLWNPELRLSAIDNFTPVTILLVAKAVFKGSLYGHFTIESLYSKEPLKIPYNLKGVTPSEIVYKVVVKTTYAGVIEGDLLIKKTMPSELLKRLPITGTVVND